MSQMQPVAVGLDCRATGCSHCGREVPWKRCLGDMHVAGTALPVRRKKSEEANQDVAARPEGHAWEFMFQTPEVFSVGILSRYFPRGKIYSLWPRCLMGHFVGVCS